MQRIASIRGIPHQLQEAEVAVVVLEAAVEAVVIRQVGTMAEAVGVVEAVVAVADLASSTARKEAPKQPAALSAAITP